jgi:DNA-binding transcriptional MocR family regulator
MQKPIDLRLNYPVLEGQDEEFTALLKSAATQSMSFLSLDATGGSLTDRSIAATWLSKPGYQVEPADVYVTGGGHHTCMVVLLAAKLQNKTIAVEEFTYLNFIAVARFLNIKLVPCAIDGEGLIPVSLAEVCSKNKVDALYIMPTVNNPLGYVTPESRRREIVAVARENNLLIIEDDAYGFLDDTALPSFFNLAPERSFFIYSLSKSYGQGIKTSYLLAPKTYAESIIDALRFTNANQSPVFSWIVNEVITTGRFGEIIKEKQKQGAIMQQKVRQLLEGYKLSGHKNGWHLWVELPENIKSDELTRRIGEAGVLISPAVIFSVTGTHNNAIRIAFGAEKDFNRIVEGIEIIKRQIADY